MYFWLTTYYRHGHNHVLLQFTIKQLEIVLRSRSSVSVSPRWRPKPQTSIRDQYPRDIVKPAGLKNDVNSMRFIERNKVSVCGRVLLVCNIGISATDLLDPL